MRVIAGRAKGVRLEQVQSGVARASLGRVREALFARLGQRVEDARVLDIFGGTGSLGIEALSRGASSCTFVDNSRSSIDVLRGNVERTGMQELATVVQHNALTAFRGEGLSCREIDLAFVDPPYPMLRDAKLFPKFVRMLGELAAGPILLPGALVVIKHEKNILNELAVAGLTLMERRPYRHAEVLEFEAG
jgi:16S rRNA (guanine966-N2)-methyltransferase